MPQGHTQSLWVQDLPRTQGETRKSGLLPSSLTLQETEQTALREGEQPVASFPRCIRPGAAAREDGSLSQREQHRTDWRAACKTPSTLGTPQ